jgi:hypothetical protein
MVIRVRIPSLGIAETAKAEDHLLGIHSVEGIGGCIIIHGKRLGKRI